MSDADLQEAVRPVPNDDGGNSATDDLRTAAEARGGQVSDIQSGDDPSDLSGGDGSAGTDPGDLRDEDDRSDGDTHRDDDRQSDALPVDPRTDPSWKPTTYRYRNASLEIIATTQTCLDDEAALAYFHVITRWGPGFRDVTYIEKAPPETSRDPKFEMMPYKFVDGEVCQLQR